MRHDYMSIAWVSSIVGNVIQVLTAMVGLHNPVEIVASEGIMCMQLFSLFRFSEGHMLQ